MNPLKVSIRMLSEELSLISLLCTKASMPELFKNLPAIDRLTILRFYQTHLVKLSMINDCKLAFYYSEIISLYKILELWPMPNDYSNLVRNNLLGKLQKMLAGCQITKISDSEITMIKS